RRFFSLGRSSGPLLSRNHFERARSSRIGFNDLEPELGRSFLEQLDLLFTVAILVVLQTLVDVLVSPLEHAIHQTGKLVRHGGDRLRCAESGAETTILAAQIALTPQQRRGGQP